MASLIKKLNDLINQKDLFFDANLNTFEANIVAVQTLNKIWE